MTKTISAGVVVALWTPTDSQGRLMEAAVARNLEFLQGKGLDGMLVLGSTGEFLFLEDQERRAFLGHAARHGGGIPMLVNVSDINPRRVVSLSHASAELGAVGLSILPPHYFPLPQHDLSAFMLHVAAAVPTLPLYLYNFPDRTGNKLELSTIREVASGARVVAVKQSGAEFGYHSELVQQGKELGYVVFTGADTRMTETMRLGVVGCVSGLANAVPELVCGACAAFRAGDSVTAERLQAQVTELGTMMSTVPFPLSVMAVMEARGLEVGTHKPVVSRQTAEEYRKVVATARGLYDRWGLKPAHS